jgi:diacylglycerol kinase family enzyme
MSRRWAARLALTGGVAALVVLLAFAGVRSLALAALGLAGLAVAAAGAWWVIAHRGPVRALGVLLAVAAPVVVVVLYVTAGLLWVVVVSFALWALAVTAGRTALRADLGQVVTPERPAPPATRPFLIMNPRSGGGKVGKFRLADRAREMGADVVVLDPARPQDVAELARQAVHKGADLLGVAGGDGTQALVAAVAAQYDVPFVVISAGTRNHFALDLGLDRDDPSACLDALTEGVELLVDLGVIGDRIFVNNASFGAYAAVVESPAYRDDKIRTTLQMLPDLLTHHSGPRLTVRAGNVTMNGPQAVLVSNNPYAMSDPAGLGRRDRLDSGVLGVLGVNVANAAQAALLLRGKNAPGLDVIKAREVVVDADPPVVQVGIDGEAVTLPAPVRCRIRPGALRVRVPLHRPGVVPSAPPMNWRRVRRLALTVGRAAAGQ